MFKLLYKEFRLAAHPTLYIFMMMGAMVLIPAYPYSTVFLYGCLAPFITFQTARENRDAFYTALLPVTRTDIVKAKCLLVVTAELGQILISLPFAFLRVLLIPGGNPVGIEANLAYYGFGFIIFAMFNCIFLTEFYKTAYKVGKAFLFAIIPATLGMVTIEVLPHLTGLEWLDSMSGADMARQIPILLTGILIYTAGTCMAYRIAVKRFQGVSL